MALLTRTDILVGINIAEDGVPAEFKICSLLHVTSGIEPLTSTTSTARDTGRELRGYPVSSSSLSGRPPISSVASNCHRWRVLSIRGSIKRSICSSEMALPPNEGLPSMGLTSPPEARRRPRGSDRQRTAVIGLQIISNLVHECPDRGPAAGEFTQASDEPIIHRWRSGKPV